MFAPAAAEDEDVHALPPSLDGRAIGGVGVWCKVERALGRNLTQISRRFLHVEIRGVGGAG
jgi:hypothetical protein